MSQGARQAAILIALGSLASVIFLTGITWGLPSRAVDPYLFGEVEPWPGQKILQLAGGWETKDNLGADVERNPILQRGRAVPLNKTDADIARILLRYRLYSNQPDEMITFRSLSQIKQTRGDPRLYQYGGLWIYPVGGLLGLAKLCGLVDLRSDVAWYLDHPEAFARFYIVARFYSAIWGIVGALAIFHLARRLTASLFLSAAATVCFIFMPVVINQAHEAKPHLAGLVLMLLAILAADRFVQTGRRRDWIATAILCGSAFAMVVSSLLIFIILPVMVLLRPIPRRQRGRLLLFSCLIALATYFLFNPYVLINALSNRAVLFSNLGTSTGMYHFSLAGPLNALGLLLEGTSPLLALSGLAAVIAWILFSLRCSPEDKTNIEHRTSNIEHRSSLPLLLAAPALLVTLQFIALASGKPAEYARFALLPDTALTLAAFTALARLLPATIKNQESKIKNSISLLLTISTIFFGLLTLRAFLRDASATPARLHEAQRLQLLHDQGARTLAVTAVPAPYCLPPVNLFEWDLLLLPPGPSAENPDVIVRPVDVPVQSPLANPVYQRLPGLPSHGPLTPRIPWADKPFDLLLKRHLTVPPLASK